MANGTSLINNNNSITPSIEPCSTPIARHSRLLLKLFPIFTIGDLLLIKDLNQSRDLPLTPAFSNLASNISWFTVSKAFLISRKMARTYSLLLIALVILLITWRIAWEVDFPFRKPNCRGIKNPFSDRKLTNLSLINF